jgi:outer membrane biosynthesis protein TonB
MQFLVYLSVLMVSISTVLLELHWLTSPAPQPKPAIQASAPPPPKVEGPSAALSPVYPKKAETIETGANAQQPTAAQPQQQAGNQSQPPQQKPHAETTGVATRGENPTPPTTAPAQAAVQQAPPETSASNNRCDIQACASTYRSFRALDCTYQPFDGGERRLCAKGPGAARSAAHDPGSQTAAVRRSNRDVFRERESERRTRVLPTDDEDDVMDADEGERYGPRLFLFGGPRRRW